MQTIVEMTEFSKGILGEQKIDYNKEYRQLNFNMIVDIDDNLLAYNNLTKKLCILSFDEANELNSKKIIPNKKNEDLIKNWFLVPVDFDECKLSEQLFGLYKNYARSDIINSFVILTTTDCNARCYYCYELGVTRNFMSKQTAEDVADYIIKVRKGQDVTIKWFGGEPLYNEEVIDIISNRLKSKNIKYSSTITSNGYLFCDENILKATNDWNVKNVQITLDGTEDVYNRIKNFIYKDDKSPFKKVINNVRKLLDASVNVNIRLNVSDNNREDIYNLVDYLSLNFGNYKNFNIYCSNLYDLNFSRTEDEIITLNNKFFELDQYIYNKGLRRFNLNKWLNHERGCMAQREKSVAITPLGLLSKCEHFSEGDKIFGSIYSDEIKKEAIDYWFQFKRIPECESCIAFPDCYGMTNCPDLSKNCDLAEKRVKEYNLENCIKEYYYQWKKDNNKNT